MLLLCSYYVRTIQLRKGGVLRGAAPQQGREGAAPPHVALSHKGILLSLPHHTQITRIGNTQKENTEGRKGNKRKEENSRKTPPKSLNPILR